jgi:hypothetical protein
MDLLRFGPLEGKYLHHTFACIDFGGYYNGAISIVGRIDASMGRVETS